MSFSYPFVFILALAILYCEFRCKRGGTKRALFSHTRFLPKEPRSIRFFYLLLFALLLIALAKPYTTTYLGTTHTKGRNIVIVLDNSPSMYWKFGTTDKISVAKEIIKKFVTKRRYDNIGLVLFAGEVYYLSPITLNHDYLLKALDRIDKNFLEGGTALYDSIDYAIQVFKNSATKNNVLIVLTDGEDTESTLSLEQLRNNLTNANAKIYTIGVGNSINEAVLTSIGHYYNATDPETLRKIYEQIDAIETYNVTSKKHYKTTYYFLYPLAIAFVLTILMIGYTHAVRPR